MAETEKRTISFICEDFDDLDEVVDTPKPQSRPPSMPPALHEQHEMVEMEVSDISDRTDKQNKPAEPAKGKRKGKKTFPIEEMKPEFENAIKSLAELVNDEPLTAKGYELSELEFNINVSTSGKVSIFSFFSGDISAGGGITVRIKKRGT